MDRAETLCAVRAAYGAALLAVPRRALGGPRLGSDEPDAVPFARALGARQLLEAGLLARRRDRRLLLAGAFVDALHGVSMLALCALSPRRRRLAAASAAGAALFAAWGLAAARPARAAPSPPAR